MVVALIDCDNFFASCERIMQPWLLEKPVAVLSNNDGCIIARTNEVKAAGVKMGQPYHECEAVLKDIGAEVVSANFLLYRSCAKRLQTILKQIPAADIEVYSIDESFVLFDETKIADIEQWATELRKLIFDWTGILVTIGVGRSRALAKVAVHVGKSTESHVVYLSDTSAKTDETLKSIPLQDVWGIGRRLAPKLRICGLATAYDLAHLQPTNPSLKLLNVTTKELIRELCGWSEGTVSSSTPRKTMTHTRSFGAAITDKQDLRAALGSFVDTLGSKLRRQGLVAAHISVFVRYREHGTEQKMGSLYSDRTVAPTADTFALESAVQAMIDELYVPGLHYKKAGVLVSDLRSAEQYQLSFDTAIEDYEKSDALMHAIDVVSNEYSIALRPAVTLLGSQIWRGKRSSVSPYDHSSWQTIPKVTA
jgi:DNA polymerase V